LEEAGVDPKPALAAGAGVAPKGAGAGALEPNDDAAGAAAGVEPKLNGAACAVVDPKPADGAAPKLCDGGAPKVGAVAGVAPKVGAGAGVAPKVGAGAGVEPKVGAGAGVEPKFAAGAGAAPKLVEGAGAAPKLTVGAGAGAVPKLGAGVAPKLGAALDAGAAGVDPKAGTLSEEVLWLLASVDDFPKVNGGAGALAGGAGAGLPKVNGAGAGASTALVDEPFPKEKVGLLDDGAFDSSSLRRFFFELASSLSFVITLPGGGPAALLGSVDAFVFPNEKVEVAAGVVGAAEAGAELLPIENPVLDAGKVVEDAEEPLPKEKAGAVFNAELSASFFSFWSFCFGVGLGDSALGASVVLFLFPNENFGAVDIAPESNLADEFTEFVAEEDPKLNGIFAVVVVDGLDAVTDAGAGAGVPPN